MSAAPLHWRSFLVPKDGHTSDECEDAVAGDAALGRFAVADGASESFAAGEWARLLVEAFVFKGPVKNWLVGPREDWSKAVSGQAMSWYAEEKLTVGGHATFLGVTTRTVDDVIEWGAVSVGDACLFHIVAGGCLSSFPLSRPSDFNTSPALVGSKAGTPAWKTTRGVLRPGEALLLTTDALAQCLLSTADDRAFAGPGLLCLEEIDDFALWVDAQRAEGKLKNDDVALGIVEFVPDAS
jgi:Protein phosphatase 2C